MAHNSPEFREADFAVTILVDSLNHFINLLVGHLKDNIALFVLREA